MTLKILVLFLIIHAAFMKDAGRPYPILCGQKPTELQKRTARPTASSISISLPSKLRACLRFVFAGMGKRVSQWPQLDKDAIH